MLCRSNVPEPVKFQLASISYSMQRWTRDPYNGPGPFKFSSKFSLPASTQPEVILNSQASNRGPREVHAHERAIATQYQFSVSTQSMVSRPTSSDSEFSDPFKFSSKFSSPASAQPEVMLNSQASDRGQRGVHAHEHAMVTPYRLSITTQSMVSAQPAVTLSSSTADKGQR